MPPNCIRFQWSLSSLMSFDRAKWLSISLESGFLKIPFMNMLSMISNSLSHTPLIQLYDRFKFQNILIRLDPSLMQQELTC